MIVDTTYFSVIDRAFVTEDSTLRANGFRGQRTGSSITLRSTKTATHAEFAYARRERDSEGDITHWEFEPTQDTLQRLPQLTGWKIVIFND